MVILRTLLDLLCGRLTGYRRLTIRGQEVIVARPIMGGADGEPDPDEGKKDDDPEKDDDPDPKPDAEAEVKKLKAEARKHERRWKERDKKIADLEAKIAEADEGKKDEHQKALDEARKEAAEAAKAEVQAELRAERLSAAIAREAAGKFADVEDAIKLLDVEDDIFDDEGKVDTETLKSSLGDLLERKPHLSAAPGKPHGDAGAGKGQGSAKDTGQQIIEAERALVGGADRDTVNQSLALKNKQFADAFFKKS